MICSLKEITKLPPENSRSNHQFKPNRTVKSLLTKTSRLANPPPKKEKKTYIEKIMYFYLQ